MMFNEGTYLFTSTIHDADDSEWEGRKHLVERHTVSKSTDSMSGFGKKTIGYIGGFGLLLNNMTGFIFSYFVSHSTKFLSGPSIPALALVVQYSGWLVGTFLIVLFTIFSYISSTFLCECMTRIEGNGFFQGRVNIVTLAKQYLGRKGYILSTAILIFSFMVANIAAVIEAAQSADATLLLLFNKTCAYELFPNNGGICVTSGIATSFLKIYQRFHPQLFPISAPHPIPSLA